MGGLTVLRALCDRLPHEHFIYLGDTARLPYGTKSAATVQRYAERAAAALIQRGVRALVIACNTASAYALEALAERYAPLPVFGVIEPGARAAVAAAATQGTAPRVLVLATEATVRQGAYAQALLRARTDARVLCRPAPLLVALAESGEPDGPLAEAILTDALRTPGTVSQVVLGCTHFPLFRATLGRLLPASTTLIDSAVTTAEAVARTLGSDDADAGGVAPAVTERCRFLATDDPRRFARLGERFLGVGIETVELIDL